MWRRAGDGERCTVLHGVRGCVTQAGCNLATEGTEGVEKRDALLGPRGVAAFYALLAVCVLVPVLSVRVPCLGDTLNHLARIHILENLRPGNVLATYYERPSRLVPYQAMDVVVGVLRGGDLEAELDAILQK